MSDTIRHTIPPSPPLRGERVGVRGALSTSVGAYSVAPIEPAAQTLCRFLSPLTPALSPRRGGEGVRLSELVS